MCDGCGLCVPGCPGGALAPAGPGRPLQWDPARCQGCDRCITVCPHRADPRARWQSVAELGAWLEPLAPFLSGVTVSGGEPLAQPDFVGAFLQRARALGLGTLVETGAAVAWSAFAPMLPQLDGALVDFKMWDEGRHRDLTGSGNARIKGNIRRRPARASWPRCGCR